MKDEDKINRWKGIIFNFRGDFVPTAYTGDIFINALGAGIGLLLGIIIYTSFRGKFFHREV